MAHQKFVVIDFNGARPKVFTGSSNLATRNEHENGDNLVMIEDRKVAIAYAIEALRLVDHFHFRMRLKEGETKAERMTLTKPPESRKKTPGTQPITGQGMRKNGIGSCLQDALVARQSPSALDLVRKPGPNLLHLWQRIFDHVGVS